MDIGILVIGSFFMCNLYFFRIFNFYVLVYFSLVYLYKERRLSKLINLLFLDVRLVNFYNNFVKILFIL